MIIFALKFYPDRVVPHQPFLAPEKYRHCASQRSSANALNMPYYLRMYISELVRFIDYATLFIIMQWRK